MVLKEIGRATVQAPYTIVKGALIELTLLVLLLLVLLLLLLVLLSLAKEAADAVKLSHANKI